MCPEQHKTIPGKSMPGMMPVRGGRSEEAEVTEGGSTAKLRQGLSLETGTCFLQLEVLNEQANLQKVFSNLKLGPLIINWAYKLLLGIDEEPGWGSKAYFHLSRRKEIRLRNRLCGKKKMWFYFTASLARSQSEVLCETQLTQPNLYPTLPGPAHVEAPGSGHYTAGRVPSCQ